jgi:hypothetical protein
MIILLHAHQLITSLAASTPGGLAPISSGHLPTTVADNNAVTNIIQLALGIIGVLAILMITVSGLRYITSAGNPEKTSKAKSGIIYALVGLMVAIAAEGIVTYVASNL